MKTAYLWVIDCTEIEGINSMVAELWFSSIEEFKRLHPLGGEDCQLVEAKVPDDFQDLDFIPDNY